MKYVPNGVSRTISRQILIAKKNSPQMMFVGGIIGVGVSTVMACRATLKLSDQLDKMKSEMSTVKQMRDDEENTEVGDRDVAYIYARNMAKVARLYAPSAIVGVASVGALTGSHVTLQRRNVGLTAAYAAMAKAYEEYRDRVKEELGDEKESDIYHNASVKKVKNEEGKLVEVKSVEFNDVSGYSRMFTRASWAWDPNPQHNRVFLLVQQTHANELLRARGHIFLNEVYDMLGFQHTTAGAVVGWVVDGEGDNYVDFGLNDSINDNFMAGDDQNAVLDFNVDGVIYDKI
jgi:hypothetical protein